MNKRKSEKRPRSIYRSHPIRFYKDKWVKVKMTKKQLEEWHKKMDELDADEEVRTNALRDDIGRALEKYESGVTKGVQEIKISIRSREGRYLYKCWPVYNFGNDFGL